MNKEEVDKVLEDVFEEALNGEGFNIPVSITLKDGTVFHGFKLLENRPAYVMGLTEDQKSYAASSPRPPYYFVTVIMKDQIEDIECITLDLGGIQRPKGL
jgi:hypothetical protein